MIDSDKIENYGCDRGWDKAEDHSCGSDRDDTEACGCDRSRIYTLEDVRVIRSSRRTMSLEINQELELVVRAPFRMPNREIEAFLREKSDWIGKHLMKMEAKREQTPQLEPKDFLTADQLQALAEQALRVLPERVAYYAHLMGVTYGRITIRNQRTRWGSCSSKGNLNFNCLLMLAPPEVQDYVVVHELSHRKEMNHSPRFWNEVASVLPEYQQYKQWLNDHGEELMRRGHGSV